MRIRTVKPSLFLHDGLFDAEKETKLPLRLAFIGLFCACDRAGRFKWQPRPLGASILPYDAIEFSRVLDALTTRGFLVKYRVNDEWFGCIPSWSRHQFVNPRETASDIPDVAERQDDGRVPDACLTREDASRKEGKGREGVGKGKEGAVEDALVLPFQSAQFIAAWETFNQHRAEKKQKPTPTAQKLALKKLAGMGEARAIAALDHSTANNWTGVFEPTVNGKPVQEPPPERIPDNLR